MGLSSWWKKRKAWKSSNLIFTTKINVSTGYSLSSEQYTSEMKLALALRQLYDIRRELNNFIDEIYKDFKAAQTVKTSPEHQWDGKIWYPLNKMGI